MDLQQSKARVRAYMAAFDAATADEMPAVLARFFAPDFLWRGPYPFNEIGSPGRVAAEFWQPLRAALSHVQRREDVFLAGCNDADGGASIWTCSMGHFFGLFERDWLAIPATRRLARLRYAEFFEVRAGELVQGALFIDIIGFMHAAGVYPLPPMTGAWFDYPGPRTRDGVMLEPQPAAEGEATLALVNQMVADLTAINHLDDFRPPPELLRRTWAEDMLWYGPCGIGASYTIARYQAQHQYPFRLNLADKTYRGHLARIAEGHYCAFFGWPNLTNRNTGGFLGLPAAAAPAGMRIVDVYRREGNKLAENWVFIDLPYYLAQQGLDVFARLAELRGLNTPQH